MGITIRDATRHERHGFARVGRLENVGLKFGRLLDVLFLQKTLH